MQRLKEDQLWKDEIGNISLFLKKRGEEEEARRRGPATHNNNQEEMMMSDMLDLIYRGDVRREGLREERGRELPISQQQNKTNHIRNILFLCLVPDHLPLNTAWRVHRATRMSLILKMLTRY